MTETRVYFGFRSPYSRLGLNVLHRAGYPVRLIPFTGPPDGTGFRDPLADAVKLKYYQQDVLRMTIRMGLPIAMPDPFDVDMAPSYRAFIAADAAGAGMAFALAVSEARWAEGKNISDADVLADCAATAGLDRGLPAEALNDPATAQALVDQRALIEQDNVFGVPFLVRGTDVFWGHDRIELFLAEYAEPAA